MGRGAGRKFRELSQREERGGHAEYDGFLDAQTQVENTRPGGENDG